MNARTRPFAWCPSHIPDLFFKFALHSLTSLLVLHPTPSRCVIGASWGCLLGQVHERLFANVCLPFQAKLCRLKRRRPFWPSAHFVSISYLLHPALKRPGHTRGKPVAVAVAVDRER